MPKIASQKSVEISPAALAALDEAIQEMTPTSGIPEQAVRQKINQLFRKIRSKNASSKIPVQNAKLA